MKLHRGRSVAASQDVLKKLGGQRQYPVIELDDGTVFGEESKHMAARIRPGELLEGYTLLASRPTGLGHSIASRN